MPIQRLSNSLYDNKWAIIIGIEEYKHWPKLKFAVDDAIEIAEILENKFQFNVLLITKAEATHTNLNNLVQTRVPSMPIGSNDCLLFYFAGHGESRAISSSDTIAYLVPIDAERQEEIQWDTLIQLDYILQLWSSKGMHILLIFDSCFSGSITSQTRGVKSTNSISRSKSRMKGRQVITAGSAGEEVLDGSAYYDDHSVFTYFLLQALENPHVRNEDKPWITAIEIYNQLSDNVTKKTNGEQNPSLGFFPPHRNGNFRFEFQEHNKFTASRNSSELQQVLMELLDSIDLNLNNQQTLAIWSLHKDDLDKGKYSLFGSEIEDILLSRKEIRLIGFDATKEILAKHSKDNNIDYYEILRQREFSILSQAFVLFFARYAASCLKRCLNLLQNS